MSDQKHGDEALRAAYQSWMRGTRDGHLDDAAWQRIAAGVALQTERDLLFAHIVTCTQCTEVWRSLAWLTREAEREGLIQPRAAARASFFRSMLIPLAIAATLAVAIGSAVLLRQPSPAPAALRGSAEASAVEGLMMAYAPDGTPTLVWTPVEGASGYLVEIFSAEGQPLWNGDVTSPPLRWPPDTARARGSYRWRVQARNADRIIARSRLTALELTR